LGFQDKTDLLDKLVLASPEYQADGRPSLQAALLMLEKASAEGLYVFEWMHQAMDGIPIPTEVTAVRIEYGDSYIIAAYVRDLREDKRMMREIEYQNQLLYTVNRISAILLQSNADSFEHDLLRSMGVIAEATRADRVYIWENYVNDGELYCYQVYEWSMGAEPQQGNDLIQGISYRDILPSWEKAFLQRKCINGIVRELATSEYDILTQQGIISILVVPIYLKEQFWGFVGFDDCHNERQFSKKEEEILRSASELIANALIRNSMEQDILHLEVEVNKIFYDPLTGIYNRRFFDETMQRVIHSLSRSGGVLSLMMIDIDYFKRYNDTYGHIKGDDCLKTVAKMLRDSVIRAEDFIARYGGEEFVVVLPNTDEAEACKVACKLVENIRSCNIPHEKSDAADCVTVSIGVTTGKAQHMQSGGNYIQRADEMLYKSKQGGRNRYTFASL
ncbi:MAG: sensor domain-containing diguanylate cyclase, partial [Spirochaetaceae bacterium]|nr:sensor domain-containing diguanylate cyclase [Spirochaetaceae bacterium]